MHEIHQMLVEAGIAEIVLQDLKDKHPECADLTLDNLTFSLVKYSESRPNDNRQYFRPKVIIDLSNPLEFIGNTDMPTVKAVWGYSYEILGKPFNPEQYEAILAIASTLEAQHSEDEELKQLESLLNQNDA